MKLSDFSTAFDPKERKGIIQWMNGINDNQTPYPKDKQIHQIWEEQVQKNPRGVALIEGDQQYYYGQIDQGANKIAAFLRERYDREEFIVAVLLEDSFSLITALLGILKAGGAYFPIDNKSPYERIRQMLEDTGAGILFSEKRFIRTVNRLQWDCAKLKSLVCLDSSHFKNELETGAMMNQEIWDMVGEETFDDISGGGWKSSYTGQWLSREVMDEYGENIKNKLIPYISDQSRVLEIGCASGISMFRLAPLVEHYRGTDLSSKVLQRTEQQAQKGKHQNIKLQHLAAHQINQLESDFYDVVIANSVIQCFPGHNYVYQVLQSAITRLKTKGIIFLGNIWDQDLKDQFIESLQQFKQDHPDQGFHTKTDRSEELFLNRTFFQDLQHEFPEIESIEFSLSAASSNSELSEYGYDVLLRINKNQEKNLSQPQQKFQFDQSHLKNYSTAVVPPRGNAHNLAYVIYTSGTTGIPKGVMVEHHSVLRLVLNTNYINLTHETRILQTGSIAFDASTFEIWGALLNGGTLIRPCPQSILNAELLNSLIQSHQANTLFLTSSLLNQIIDQDLNLFSGLSHLLTGGERASRSHFNRLHKAHPKLQIIHAYGPTENTAFSTTYPITKQYDRDIPIGIPIANSQIWILNKKGEPLAANQTGEICVGGAGLARGYLGDPRLTEQNFIPHPFEKGERLYLTGDLGRLTREGVLEYLGRKDRQVKVRGYRIEPAEIEANLLEINGVEQAFVTSYLGQDGNQELAAYYTGDAEISSIQQSLKQSLPPYMIPLHWFPLAQLPLATTGKIDLRALPRIPEATTAIVQEEVLTLTEQRLLSLWQKVLGKTAISVRENFFDCGGHSLKLTKLVSMIHKEFKVELPLVSVFKNPTIRKMAQSLLQHCHFGMAEMDEALIPLNGSQQGSKVFAFPPGTGDALGYLQLAACLKPFSFLGFNFIESENLVSAYADLVLKEDAQGPYILFGYSSGGNLAYQVAGELESRGYHVTDVILVDSARKLRPFQFPPEEVERVTKSFLEHESLRPYLDNPLWVDKIRQQIQASYQYISHSTDQHQVKADLHLLVSPDSEDKFLDESGQLIASTSAWQEATKGCFYSYPGEGDHNGMLYPPHLEHNSSILMGILQRATTQSTPDEMQVFIDLESQVRSYSRSFPKLFASSKGAFLFDHHGKRYIDFFAGAGALNYGHNPEPMKKALIKTLEKDGIMHSLDMATVAKKTFLESFQKIILSPRGLEYKMQFTGPTGTNAVEAALKLARKVKQRSSIIAFTNGYHGLTSGALSVTANSFYRQDLPPAPADVTFLPYDGYFGPDTDSLSYLRQLLEDPGSGLDLPAAIILETIQAEGGINVAGITWLQELAQLCQEKDILLILDEIQVGNGRTGTFFSFERAGIKPDLVVLSKSLSGSGLPLSMLLIKPEWDIWAPGEHTGTFRGNNLAFVTATEALNYWQDDSFSREIGQKGLLLHKKLTQLQQHFPHLNLQIRGLGMIYGLVFESASLCKQVTQKSFEKGLILETCGPDNRVLKFLPPLTISNEILQEGMDILHQAITEVS